MTEKQNDEEKDNKSDKQNKDFTDDQTDSFIKHSHELGTTEEEPTWSFSIIFSPISHNRWYQNFNGNNI